MRCSVMVVVALAGSAVLAEETMSWRIVGSSSTAQRESDDPLSWAVVGPCVCRGGEECACGSDCRCQGAKHDKPVAFAYKDLNLVCPGCIRLDQQSADLPVRLEWKQAPAWVKSYPTLHWQGRDGRWYQYRWGSTENDMIAFRRVWESTQDSPSSTSSLDVHRVNIRRVANAR